MLHHQSNLSFQNVRSLGIDEKGTDDVLKEIHQNMKRISMKMKEVFFVVVGTFWKMVKLFEF